MNHYIDGILGNNKPITSMKEKMYVILKKIENKNNNNNNKKIRN